MNATTTKSKSRELYRQLLILSADAIVVVAIIALYKLIMP